MKRFSSLIFIFALCILIAKAQTVSIDLSFNTDFDFGRDEIINTLAVQPDGKMIIGGKFAVPFINQNRIHNILRFHKNGSLDTNFRIGTGFNYPVSSLLIDSTGNILVIGQFGTFNSIKCVNFARILSDGALDNTFVKPSSLLNVSLLALQENNKILLGGITEYGGFGQMPISKLARINSNGSLDSTFKANEIVGFLGNIAIQSDGKSIISGNFKTFNGRRINNLFRLENDGSLDTTFNLNFSVSSGIGCMIVQDNDNVLVGGLMKFADNNFHNIFRINGKGDLDETFKTVKWFEQDGNSSVNAIYLQKNGKVILGGSSSVFSGINNNSFIRLNSNGTQDFTFTTGEGFNNRVNCVARYSEYKIIVAGAFRRYDSYLRSHIVRFNLEDINQQKITVSPNPNTGKFRINSPHLINLVTITNTVGEVILRIEPLSDDFEIDLTDQASGMYVVKSDFENGNLVQKVLKQ